MNTDQRAAATIAAKNDAYSTSPGYSNVQPKGELGVLDARLDALGDVAHS